MKETSYISVVVVAQEITEQFVRYMREVHESLRTTFEHYEVVIVSNGGEGITNDALVSALKVYPHTSILVSLPHQHTEEVAGYVGLEYAKGDYVLEIEYIDEHFPAENIPRMFAHVAEGYDIVSAVPERKPSLFSKLFYSLLKQTSFVPLNLETEHMRLVTRRALNALFQIKQRTKYRKLLYAYTGFRRSVITYTPSTGVHPTRAERSFIDRFSLATDVFISYTTIVVRATLTLALIFLALSILGGLYAIGIYFLKDIRIEGWTTMMLFVSFGFSGIFLILAMIVKYLESILRETQSAPLYIVGSAHIIVNNESHPHV